MSLPIRQVEAALVDVDGVLINSRDHSDRQWSRFADRHGLPLDEVMSRTGGSTIGAMQAINTDLCRGRLKPKLELIEFDRQAAEDMTGLKLMPGAMQFTEAWDGRWAVVTSGGTPFKLPRFEHFGLVVPEVCITAESLPARFGKPLPDPYRLAAALLGVPTLNCAGFEDSPTGLDAVLSAGTGLVVRIGDKDPKTQALRDHDLQVPDLSHLAVQRIDNGFTLNVRSPREMRRQMGEIDL